MSAQLYLIIHNIIIRNIYVIFREKVGKVKTHHILGDSMLSRQKDARITLDIDETDTPVALEFMMDIPSIDYNISSETPLIIEGDGLYNLAVNLWNNHNNQLNQVKNIFTIIQEALSKTKLEKPNDLAE